MKQHRGLYIAFLAAATFSSSLGTAFAQTTAPGFAAPRTSWGVPDLQGTWSNASITDMQREAEFPDLVLTQAEAAKMEGTDYYNISTREELRPSDTRDTRLLDGRDLLSGGGYNSFWIDQGSKVATVRGTLRSSWIVDPADGRIPYKDPARRRGGAAAGGSATSINAIERYIPQTSTRDPSKLTLGGPIPVTPARGGGEGSYDNVETRPLSERCLIGFGNTGGPVMNNVIYNNRYQIVQSPTHVMILVEMAHDARIIPISKERVRPEAIKPWLGDSIGWYEGDTLVIETRNVNPLQRGYISAQGRVTERFSRWSEDQITYEFTVEDPSLYSQPWRGEMSMNATGPIYEYACHEGNYSMQGILAGARKLESEGKSVIPNFDEEG